MLKFKLILFLAVIILSLVDYGSTEFNLHSMVNGTETTTPVTRVIKGNFVDPMSFRITQFSNSESGTTVPKLVEGNFVDRMSSRLTQFSNSEEETSTFRTKVTTDRYSTLLGGNYVDPWATRITQTSGRDNGAGNGFQNFLGGLLESFKKSQESQSVSERFTAYSAPTIYSAPIQSEPRLQKLVYGRKYPW